jgi:hypothetical protein
MTEKKVKFAEEKMMNKRKKIWRNKDRQYKYEEEEAKVYEEPQMETPKEFEESVAHYKRCCNPKDPLYQAPTETLKASVSAWKPFTPLKIIDYLPCVIYEWEPEPEPEPQIKWWNNKVIRDEYDLEDDNDGWFD